uniref:Uncharacterized protein n=1 Tax=Anguilla anguilla TaxID=7936 RepID=A0A0E9WGK0_ANGAN
MTLSNIWYSLMRLIALSTWILKRAISCVCVISALLNCPLGPKNVGITSLTFMSVRRSLIRNPLSAMTSSPGCRRLRMPDSLVISLSEMEPVYRLLTRQIDPEGVMPISDFSVVVPL